MTPPALASPPFPAASRQTAGPPAPAEAPPALRRFTVDEYHKMIQAGILVEGEPVELLEGWLTIKMGRNPLHDTAIGLAMEALRALLPAGWRVRAQSALTLGGSEPEPDLTVVRGGIRDFSNRHPGAADCVIAVESADSSLHQDRTLKARVYARAGIPVYWILNVAENQVEVYMNPGEAEGEPAYRDRRDYRPGGEPVPVVVGGEKIGEIPAADLLP